MTESGEKAKQKPEDDLSLRKKLLYALIINLLIFGVVETGVRVGAFFAYGASPYFLLYGFRTEGDANPDGHSVAGDGYAKFPPNRALSQYGMFQEPTPIRINAAGLRGADFDPDKPASTVRIASLGGSSTFGFYSRDDHTYPARLDAGFEETACGDVVEVINAGVPHAKSWNILAMLRGEILDYDPDFITVYTGYNDAVTVFDANLAQKTVRWLHEHVVSFVGLKMLLTKLGGRNLSRTQWARHRTGSSSEYVRRQIELHVEEFRANLRDLVDAAAERGVGVVLIKQAIDIVDDGEQQTQAARVRAARDRLDGGGGLTDREALLLIHDALMSELDRVAGARDLPVVDNIAIVDRDPELMASYVHLSEAGNQALADALQETLRPQVESVLASRGAAADCEPSPASR